MAEDIKHIGEKRQGRGLIEAPKRETFERDYSRYDFSFPTDHYTYISKPGLSRGVVEEISRIKDEPDWMREFRLQAYEVFRKKPLPMWGADLTSIDFDTITYYARPTDRAARSWDDVPEEIKKTFDRLGIPEAERKFLAGVGAQYDSETVYHSIREDLKKKGVIFLGMDDGLKEYPEIVKEYFGTVIPKEDNKFAALNSAVWSGGSFIYVPPGVQVEIPLQAYFRINAANMGQFERTLIIADEGAKVHYIEGCLPGGEQVSLGDRWVNVESLKPGDFVVASNGQKARVRAVMVRPYRGQLVEVKPISPHNAFRLTPEHPVLCVRRADVTVKRKPRNGWLPEVDSKKLKATKPTYRPVGELRVGDFIVFPKVQATGYNPNFSRKQLRLLGYYLAEGSAFVHKALKQAVVAFSFGEHEIDHIEKVKQLIRTMTGKAPQVVHLRRKHSVTVSVYSRELMEFCLKHAGKGAQSKKLSEEIMALPAEQLAPLLDAYSAGDGNACMKGNSEMRRISTASQTLARQIQELLARRGIYASIEVRKSGEDTIKGRRIHRKDQFIVVWTHDKRTGEVRDAGDYFLVPIKEINRLPYDGFVFNLDVEEPNSYLVRGFAVHNCTAPVYSRESLHSAVVELIAKRGAHLRYTTLQNWSNDVYNLVTKRAVAYEGATVEWVDANIGCLTADTQIYTNPEGLTAIKDLQPGEHVYALDLDTLSFKRFRVNAVVCNGIRDVYEVTLAGRTLRATDNHPFLVLSRLNRYGSRNIGHVSAFALQWKPLKDITSDDFVAYVRQLPDDGKPYRIAFTPSYRYQRPRVRIPGQTNDDLMWLLGLYLGDGFTWWVKGKRSAVVYFAIPTKEKDLRERLLRTLREQFAATYHLKDKCVAVSSLALAQLLIHLGLQGNAHEKRIPKWVYSLPLSQKLSFIEGFLDADGSVHTSHQQITFTSCNRPLLEDLKLLCVACGLTVYSTRQYTAKRRLQGKYEGTYTHYQFCLSKKDLEKIRGKDVDVGSQIAFSPLRSIRHLGQQEVYDIEVEGAHNFVANGIIVHNSRVTMKYPSVYMLGKGAKADILSVAYAGKGQHQDAGGKAIHAAPYTTSTIISKSVSKDGGRTTYRGQLKVIKGAVGAKSSVRCDALLLDEHSRSDTYPYIEIDEDRVTIGHEATVGKVGEDQIFYLMSRGLSEGEALSMIVLGFMEPFTKTLPMEYAIEFNRLIQLEMSGSVG